MKRDNIKTIPYRRKREGKTNYKKRLRLIVSGKPRLVIRNSSTRTITQLIEFAPQGDIVHVGVDSTNLKAHGWKGSIKNIPAAYMSGYLLGKKALAAGMSEAVVDIGFHTTLPGAKIFAVVKGAIDAGMNIPSGEEVFPSQERLEGKHIEGFSNNLETIKKSMEKQ